MRCLKPFVTRQAAFGCGQCLPCRVARRRTWTHRLLLETFEHDCSSFVTLTYDDEYLPKDGSLYPEHLRNWLKRMRKSVASRFTVSGGHPRRLRFYSVGEYGDHTDRPHYHVALYGWPPCSRQGSQASGVCQCLACSVVRETWGFGHVMVAHLSARSAQYIAGYVTKKMTRFDDPRLRGRYPEFARMSLRPGIGATAMWNVASEMMRYRLEQRGDVPLALRYGSQQLPLGNYLRRKLRTYVGKDEKAPEWALQESANKLQIVRAFAFANDRSVASVFEEINEPNSRRLAARLTAKGTL